MKKLLIIAALAALAGCTSTTIKTDGWEAKIGNHWFAKDVDKFNVTRSADGSYSIDLNGYREDVSEKLPLFTKEMWYGIGIIGRIAAAVANPVAASVPLTEEAANAEQVAALVKANAEAKAELAKAKAEAAALKAEAQAKAEAIAKGCNGTVCTDGTCDTCKGGSCTK